MHDACVEAKIPFGISTAMKKFNENTKV